MKNNALLLLLFFFCTSVISCKKESKPEPEKEYLKVPDEIWSYVYLTPGSWYIYKDSATGLTDSVVVTKSVINYKAPVLNFITGSTLFFTDDYLLILDKVDLAGSKTLWLGAMSRGNISSNIKVWELPGLMQYPYTAPGSPVIYKIPTATIEGNNYSDILVEVGAFSSAWWVKGVGLIKLIYRGNTFTLLRKK